MVARENFLYPKNNKIPRLGRIITKRGIFKAISKNLFIHIAQKKETGYGFLFKNIL
jgi:hypothetical protein